MRQRRCTNGRAATLLLLAVVGLVGGCVNVRAPDKPIEINLNIKISGAVVVSLAKDAQDLIAKNPELFPE